MLFNETYDKFVNLAKQCNLKILDNNDDLLIFPITDSAISSVRTPFQLHIDEEVLYIRDTSFWSSKDQGLVFTDWGITIVPDNDDANTFYQFPWVDIEYAEYNGMSVYLFKSDNRNDHFEIPINFLLKDTSNDSDCQNNGKLLASIFTQLAQTQTGDNAEKALARMETALSNGDNEKTIEEADTALSLSNDEDVTWRAKVYKFYALKGIGFQHEWTSEMSDEERNKEISARQQYFISADNVLDDLISIRGQFDWIFNEKGILRTNGTDLFNCELARRYFIKAMGAEDKDTQQSAQNNYIWATNYLFNTEYDFYVNDLPELLKDCKTEEDRKDYIELAELSKFCSIPVNERQFLLLAKDVKHIAGYYDEEDNIKWVFTLDRIPKDIVFDGVPIHNTLYIAHPVKQNMYLKFENAEERIFMEKVREFCYMVQCLGAKNVTFKSIKGLKVEEEEKNLQHIDGKIDTLLVDTNADASRNTHKTYKHDSNVEVGLTQSFPRLLNPKCPEGLVWLQYDSEWRMLVKQRLEGGMLSYNYRIKSVDTCNISTNQINDVRVSFEHMLTSANVNYKAELDTTFKKHVDTEWEINVEFYPLNSDDCADYSSTGVANISKEEQEYLDEYKEMLADGEISDRDRRFLDKIKKANGISDARAAELEASCVVRLSPEEQEYLDEYKGILADGEISDRDRRFLDKIKKANGISDNRAAEIEKLA